MATRVGKKTVGLDWQNNNFACASPFFCTFLCRRCTTTMWNCLISLFVENVNTWQWLPFPFSELWYSPLELNSRKIHQHLTNWTRWNKHDKVWGGGNSLFKWRFCSHHCHCCLSSLMPWDSKGMFHNNCSVPFLHMNNFFSCFGFWLLHRLFKFWRNGFLFIYKRNNFIILIEGIWSMKRRE